MAVNRNIFIHDSDRSALQALKSIPGFSTVVKAFMRIWDEKLYRIRNMSTNVRISEKQLPEYYNMLLPVCDRLGIAVPDLYLTQDDNPNAWTSGDSSPVITITSGLIEKFPEHLIRTVLAHECGHIVCHHVLYLTMGRLLQEGVFRFVPLSDMAIIPIQAAFSYWMRCSEFSADRAAILCDDGPDNTMELCIRAAGFNNGIPYDMNMDAFMEQAGEYRKMMADSKVNKTLELLLFGLNDHPLHAVRVYEAKTWAGSEDFEKAKQFFDTYNREEAHTEVPVSGNERTFIGRKPDDVESELRGLGFEDIERVRVTEKPLFARSGRVAGVRIDGDNGYKAGDWIAADAVVEISYYQPLSEEEEAALHPGEIRMPHSAFYYKGSPVSEVEAALLACGFENLVLEAVPDIEKENDRNLDKVIGVTIDESERFTKGDWVSSMAEIRVTYHAPV